MPFAVVFPGQGSQGVGMLGALAATHGVVGAAFAEASEALEFDLAGLIREGPAEELNRTENTQPALLAAGVAVWRLWRERGGARPAALAGHSLGEYSALVAAGAIGFADAVRLVRQRGRFMQVAVPEGTGAMTAIIGFDAEAVAKVCAEAADLGVVAPANLNSPVQTVISGERQAVEKAGKLASEAGAKRVIPLAVSVPSHSILMQPAAEQLATKLAAIGVRAPDIPVVNNADVAAPSDPDDIRAALARQLTQPVRWTETIASLRDDYGVNRVFEFGPGGVLTGLGRRTDRRAIEWASVGDPDELEAALGAL